MQGIFVHNDLRLTETARSAPARLVQEKQNIRFMFWIACPAEPFTRLSSTQMTVARFAMRRRYFGMTPVAVARDARARASGNAARHAGDSFSALALRHVRIRPPPGWTS
jgi:hypothetical protein